MVVYLFIDIVMEVGEYRRSVHGSGGQLGEDTQDIRYTPTAS